MGYGRMLAATTAQDWAGLAGLVLLSLGAAFYAVLVALRARQVVRAGWSGVRAHPGALLGLLCGITALAVVLFYLDIGWAAGQNAATAVWNRQRWEAIPLTVCGSVFLWTEPGRRRSVWDRAISLKLRAHPRQTLGGFLVGVATWGIFPLMPTLPQPVRFLCLLAWPLLLLVELGCAAWWWSRHGRSEELTDTDRAVSLPAYVTHPAFWGWIWGTVGTLLLFTMLAQMPLRC